MPKLKEKGRRKNKARARVTCKPTLRGIWHPLSFSSGKDSHNVSLLAGEPTFFLAIPFKTVWEGVTAK